MKRISINAIGLLVILMVVVSCNKKPTEHNDQTVSTERNAETLPDSVKIDCSAFEEKSDEQILDMDVKNASLNDLICAYSRFNDSDRESQFAASPKVKEFVSLVMREIYDRHKIDSIEFRKYRDAYLSILLPTGTTPLDEHEISKSDLDDFVNVNGEERYLKIKFTDKNEDKYYITPTDFHYFRSGHSCVTFTLLHKIAYNSDEFISLKVVKGIKTLVKSPTCKYEGTFTIAMLVYTSKNKQTGALTTEFFDIVEDPTHKGK